MLGFLFLGIMLAFSGMISMFQLNKLSSHTQNLLNNSMKSMELSKDMLDATQEQNTSLLHIVVLGHNQLDSAFTYAGKAFERALNKASNMSGHTLELDLIYRARNDYNRLINDFFSTPGEKDIEWFMEMYGSSYLALTNAIKDYMVASQQSMLQKAESLERNAYRAIMPGIVTLCVAIIIVIMFAFLMDIYYIRPIQDMTNGLTSFLKHKFPYNVEVDGNDEITKLNDQIEELSTLARNRMNE